MGANNIHMAITIEKNIPITPKNPKFWRKPQLKYPFAQMEVGDSFFVECDKDDARNMQVNLGVMGRRENKSTGKKFTTRQSEGGVRVWRIE